MTLNLLDARLSPTEALSTNAALYVCLAVVVFAMLLGFSISPFEPVTGSIVTMLGVVPILIVASARLLLPKVEYGVVRLMTARMHTVTMTGRFPVIDRPPAFWPGWLGSVWINFHPNKEIAGWCRENLVGAWRVVPVQSWHLFDDPYEITLAFEDVEDRDRFAARWS